LRSQNDLWQNGDMSTEARKQIAVPIPAAALRKFKALAATEGKTQGAIIRSLIYAYIKTAKTRKGIPA
jgi:hypothetical protein